MQPADVLDLYEEGVVAIQQAGAMRADAEWQERVCGSWSAEDLAGHLVCVVHWYHAWLDRAEAGDGAPPFPVDELPARNATALVELGPATGPGRVAEFAREARRYAARLPPVWDVPYGYPLGTVTAGLHAGVAAGEWSIHAWDLSGGGYRPSRPRALFAAVAEGFTAAQGGLVGRASRALAPLVAMRKPWEQMLRRSGRRP